MALLFIVSVKPEAAAESEELGTDPVMELVTRTLQGMVRTR